MLQHVIARRMAGFGLIAALSLAGCATLPHPAPATADQPAATNAEHEDAPDADGAEQTSAATKEDESAYPKQALTPELLFGFLIGDFAAQEGNRPLAADTWLELSHRTHDPRVAERALELAIQSGNYDRMLTAARQWREYAPNSVQARYTYVVALVTGRQLDNAEKELLQWIQDVPADAAAILLDVHSMTAKYTDKSAVLAMTRRLADTRPDLPEAPMAVSLAAEDADESLAAIQAADEAIKRRPDWISAIAFRAELTEKGSPEQAVAYLKAAYERLPHAVQLKVLLARAESTAGHYDVARTLYRELSRERPQEIEFAVGEALADMELRKLDDAQAALERALTLHPKNPSVVHYHLGIIAEDQGRLDDARREYNLANDTAYTAQTATRLAHVEAKAGNRDAALADLARVPNDTPANQISHLQLEAQIWSDLKDLGKARNVLDEGLIAHADNADLLYDRSIIFDRLGDIGDAERDLRRYLELNPDSTVGLNALGYTLANRTDRLDEAEKLIRQALAKEPNNPVIQDSFGWLLVRRGKFDEGSQWLGKAFAAMPDPEIAAHYGEALWHIGKQGEARKIWEAGRKLDPTEEVLSETVHRLTGQ